MDDPDEAGPWYRRIWQMADGRMAKLSQDLQRTLRMLRLARALLVVSISIVLVSGGVAVVWPEYLAYCFAVSSLFLIIPMVAMAYLVEMPLRWKGIVRLVERGYPANAKELAIRIAARKLHDQSIETEELLVETALNESRKLARKYRERAERMKAERAGAASGGSGTGPSAPDHAGAPPTTSPPRPPPA